MPVEPPVEDHEKLPELTTLAPIDVIPKTPVLGLATRLLPDRTNELTPERTSAPADVNATVLVPFTCRSSRFPAKPLAALTPRPVPLVLQDVEVVPVGSITT